VTTLRKSVAIVLWAIAFALPIAFFFAGAGATFPDGPLVRIYSAATQAIGETAARTIFCLSWLAIDALLFWRLVVSKRPVVPDPEGWPQE
jgi:hypothetical protein